MLRDAPLIFVVGVATVFAGLAMVLAHNVWSGAAYAVIVTLVGWATLIKGLLLMVLTPDAEAAVFLKGLHYSEFFHLYAAISLAAGAYLTYRGFSKNPRA